MSRGAFDAPTRRIIRTRSNGVCERCLARRAAQMHHRTPRQAGGSRAAWISQASNGVDLCNECHRWVESNRSAAEATGWVVPRGEAEQTDGNADRPVCDVIGNRWLLTDDGDKLTL